MNSVAKKKFVFSIITLVIPAIILLVAELGLRLLVPSLKNPFVHEVRYDNIEWYQVNRSYLKKFFPAGTPSIPELKPSLFRKEKLPNSYRVVCLGGSSMFGTPYQMTATMPGIIRKQLRHLLPGSEVEVINLGASAINSEVVKKIAREIVKYQPDLVLVYMGHNEFYGPEGVGATRLEKKFPFLISLKYTLRELRIYQVLEKMIHSLASHSSQTAERNLMRQVSRGQLVPLESADAERIFRIFSDNLAQLIDIFREKGTPLVVSDVASNLQFEPFIWPSLDTLGNLRLDLEEAELAYQQQHYQEAINCLMPDYEKYREHPLLNFRLGKYYLKAGDKERALFHFREARDQDLLKFRAPSQIDSIIHGVCREKKVPVMSAEKYINSVSKNGISGYDLFWEHLHLRWEGYYKIAELFLQKILEEKYLPVEEKFSDHAELIPADANQLSICWLDKAYGEMSIRNLTGKWPFRNNLKYDSGILLAEPNLIRIVSDVYQNRIVWDEGCYRTAAYFEKTGDYRQAETTYQAIIEEYPFNFYAHYQLARMYKDTGRLEEALEHYQISTRSKPDYLYSWLEMGMVAINLGRFNEAVASLNKALALSSGEKNPAIRANIYYGLSAAFANRRDFDKALNFVNQALAILPDYAAAVELRQYILKFQANK
jgi:tetratricopeptide (TPR) repeat protein